jgi:hypothetical protein
MHQMPEQVQSNEIGQIAIKHPPNKLKSS